jgi:xylan 1,4-beta-xylosidase
MTQTKPPAGPEAPAFTPAAVSIPSTDATDAKADWDARILIRRDEDTARLDGAIGPPQSLTADAGRGQVTLRWDPVPGAVGYVVHKAASRDGPWEPLDHGGRDHLVMPPDPYVDTTVEPGTERWYAVASTAAVEARPGRLSRPVSGTPQADGTARVEISVDAASNGGPLRHPWRPMIGSEHLSQLLDEGTTGGRPIGREFAEAIRIAHDELNVQSVRAHGILMDDLGVYQEVDGRAVHDFSGVDRVYDRLQALGVRPVVELSFMPREMASDPSKTVFSYRAIVSPPKELRRWEALVRDLTAHLAGRYGADEVAENWSFEVWNEANLEIFWSGSRRDYLDLYDASARAVKSVDARFRVGGPSSAAGGWLATLLDHSNESDVPVDFLSTHTYGNPPFDAAEAARARGRADVPVWWTEWGVGPMHFSRIGDSPFAAAFIARGMKAAHDRAETLSYWTVSDHFEELGRPPALFHGGFGIMTVGNLRKPRFWALSMLERLGSDLVECELSGDGAGSLVDAWATRGGPPSDGSASSERSRSDEGTYADRRISVVVWNGTLDQAKAGGDAALSRAIAIRVEGLGDGDYMLRHWRVDETHSNIRDVWEGMGGGDWPDESGWEALRAANRLEELEPERRVRADGGRIGLEFELPMPAISFVEIVPAD